MGAFAEKQIGYSGQGSTLGLALSGGAVLGCSQIGVLQALGEAGIRVTHLAGTSIGALVAAFYSFGLTPREIENIARSITWSDLTRPTASRLGLLSQEGLRRTLRARIGDVLLEDAPIPLAMVATDISTGEKVVMEEGNLAVAASASACFPGIFVPVEREGRLLVDGGLVEQLPVSPLQAWEVDRIIGVDVFLGMTFHRPAKFLHLMKNAVDIVLVEGSRRVMADVDLLITPDLQEFSSTELKDVPGLVKAGYQAAQRALAHSPFFDR
ncbi:MAG: patatin-like phospholipase family protein [Gemmatimonadota bacterium]|jgi:NTE family protein